MSQNYFDQYVNRIGLEASLDKYNRAKANK